MDIKEKVSIIEESCKRLVKKDKLELNKIIDSEIEKRIKDEIKSYQ